MEEAYLGRKSHSVNGVIHWAEVVTRAKPCHGLTEVILSSLALSILRETFGADFEHQRECVRSAIAVQIDTANIAGELPRVGASRFQAEVVEVRVSGNAGRDLSGFLLSAAGMDAIGAFLNAWEASQTV